MAIGELKSVWAAISPVAVAWLLTYAIHSTLLSGLAWLITRYVRSHRLKDLLWKTTPVHPFGRLRTPLVWGQGETTSETVPGTHSLSESSFDRGWELTGSPSSNVMPSGAVLGGCLGFGWWAQQQQVYGLVSPHDDSTPVVSAVVVTFPMILSPMYSPDFVLLPACGVVCG
jgi:hypothetical protein